MFNWTKYGLWQKPNRTTMWPIYRFGLRKKQNKTIGTYLTRCGRWWKQYRMMWLIIHVRSTLKTIMNCHDWWNWMQSLMKTRADNDATDHTGAVYIKNGTKLLWLIRSSINSYEKKTIQLRDWGYKYNLSQKWNWAVMTDQTRYSLWRKPDRTMTWPIV